jgi:hypothetical protein
MLFHVTIKILTSSHHCNTFASYAESLLEKFASDSIRIYTDKARRALVAEGFDYQLLAALPLWKQISKKMSNSPIEGIGVLMIPAELSQNRWISNDWRQLTCRIHQFCSNSILDS